MIRSRFRRLFKAARRDTKGRGGSIAGLLHPPRRRGEGNALPRHSGARRRAANPECITTDLSASSPAGKKGRRRRKAHAIHCPRTFRRCSLLVQARDARRGRSGFGSEKGSKIKRPKGVTNLVRAIGRGLCSTETLTQVSFKRSTRPRHRAFRLRTQILVSNSGSCCTIVTMMAPLNEVKFNEGDRAKATPRKTLQHRLQTHSRNSESWL